MTSSLSYALTGAEQLIADCPAFQARVGGESGPVSSEVAKGNIYYFEGSINEIGDPNNTLRSQRPMVVLNILEAGYRQFGQDDGMNLGAISGILVQFQDNPSTEGDVKTQLADFAEYIGQVIDWISCHVGRDQPDGNPDMSVTYYPFRMLMQITPIQRSDLAQRQSDDFFLTEWLFSASVSEGH